MESLVFRLFLVTGCQVTWRISSRNCFRRSSFSLPMIESLPPSRGPLATKTRPRPPESSSDCCPTVQMFNYLTGVPWKGGTGTRFLPFIGQEMGVSRNLQAVSKVHFQILFTWQENHQGKCETHVLLFTPTSYERKYVSDQSMLVFCFHDHTFVVYLWTAKVDKNSIFKEPTLLFLL